MQQAASSITDYCHSVGLYVPAVEPQIWTRSWTCVIHLTRLHVCLGAGIAQSVHDSYHPNVGFHCQLLIYMESWQFQHIFIIIYCKSGAIYVCRSPTKKRTTENAEVRKGRRKICKIYRVWKQGETLQRTMQYTLISPHKLWRKSTFPAEK
jgi:hypothetical protein